MNRGVILCIALLIASIPTLLWYVMRTQDGGGELAGMIPLAAAMLFAIRDRRSLGIEARGAWIAVVLIVFQAASYPILPSMIRAILMIAAVVSVFGVWRKPGIVSLLIAALPWTSSLDFYLGYPLRLVTSINSAFFLRLTGTEVDRAGVQLLYGGEVVGVDPACSGINMLWSTGLLTALLSASFLLRWRDLVFLAAIALLLAIAGNSLRAALLFFPEAGIVEMPHLLHPGIGIAISGGVFLILVKIARRLAGPVEVRRSDYTVPKPAVVALLLVASTLLILASFISASGISGSSPTQPPITSYRGIPVFRIELTPSEKNFYRSFPGSIAVYESKNSKIILRKMTRATRMLHPASHCLRAEGFRIGNNSIIDDIDGRWNSYIATRDSSIYHVREQIFCNKTKRTWPEVSSWFWRAFFHPNEGPWEAVTAIQSLRR